MGRPMLKTPEQRKKELLAFQRREKAKAARRARYLEKKALEAATNAAEGEADIENAARDPSQPRKGKVSPPKVVVSAKENLSNAFDLMGGVHALVRWGKKYPTEFYRIWARLIPKEAVEQTQALPLEDLLSRLATKSEKTVAEAAYEIGEETLAAARKQVSIEDAAAAFVRSEEDTIQ